MSGQQLALWAEHYSGPLPPAEQLAQYEDVWPGLADRIVRMAESELAHQQHMQHLGVTQPYRIATRGQAYGLAGLVCFLIFAGYLAYLGATAWAGVLAGFDIIAIVALFITGQTDSSHKDDQDKEDDVRPPQV